MFARSSNRRSPWLRGLSLASALALVLGGTADAYGLHRCAHHDALPPAAPAGAAAHAGHASGAAHEVGAAHGVDGAHADAHSGHADPSSDHGATCTCLGDCAGSAGAAAPKPSIETMLPAPTSVGVVVARPSDSPLASQAPHFLPFAHAPPLAR